MTMTDISPYKPVPLGVVASEPARPRLLLIGTALASAAVFVGYASIIGFYLSQRAAVRAGGDAWLPDGVKIPLTQPNFMLLTLSFSAVSMLWALSSVRHDDRANAFLAFGLTLVFGFAQVAQTAYLFSLMALPVAGSAAGALILTLIGLQLAVAAAAMAYVVAMALRTLGGGYSSNDYEGVLCAVVFWMTSVGVYTLLWYAVYITK
jgi:heme/copper-type cytochrome/quinol oxidase subunit 3